MDHKVIEIPIPTKYGCLSRSFCVLFRKSLSSQISLLTGVLALCRSNRVEILRNEIHAVISNNSMEENEGNGSSSEDAKDIAIKVAEVMSYKSLQCLNIY
jgi:hypothetical protein